jgi:hypothetical protein
MKILLQKNFKVYINVSKTEREEKGIRTGGRYSQTFKKALPEMRKSLTMNY